MNAANFSELGIKVGSIVKGKCCQFISPSKVIVSKDTFESEVTKITEKFVYFNSSDRGTGFTKLASLIRIGAWEVTNK